MPGWRDDVPFTGGNVGSPLGPRKLDQCDAERLDPGFDPARCLRGGQVPGPVIFQFLECIGDLANGRVREAGRVHDLRSAETPRGFGDQLADGDRVEMKIDQHPAVALDGGGWEFHLLGDDFAHGAPSVCAGGCGGGARGLWEGREGR